MKKLITAALAALTITSFSIAAAPAQAAPTSASLQHRVATQTGSQTEGLMYGMCYYYPCLCS